MCVCVVCVCVYNFTFITVPHQDDKSKVLAQFNTYASNKYTSYSEVDGDDGTKNVPLNVCK